LTQGSLNGVGWESVQDEILHAATAARGIPAFDEELRSNEVGRQVARAKKFALWPLILVIAAFFLPYAWLWVAGLLLVWGNHVRVALVRGAKVQADLAIESAELREQARRSAANVRAALAGANEGTLPALDFLLNRWLDHRPPSIEKFTAQISGTFNTGWTIIGDAIRRDMIPANAPRIGRGGHIVYDKRKAPELDEDLIELNALAVISILSALFSLSTKQHITVCISITNNNTAPVPWVTLFGLIGNREIASVVTGDNRLARSPSECIRTLGGDVGHCRSQRLTPAGKPFVASTIPAGAVQQAAQQTVRVITQPIVSKSESQATHPYASNAAEVYFGNTHETDQLAECVPTPPGGSANELTSSREISRGLVPSVSNVHGEFSVVARRFATYEGDPEARFVQFETYWPTYQNMTPGQLKFYFKWRNAARQGDVPRSELSYVFVHIYELLHLIGASGARDAAEQIEALWHHYRPVFPKLDGYCVRWIADLYAKEVDSAAAVEFIRGASACGSRLGPDEALLLTDDYWATGDYAGMPRAGIAILTGDQRRGENKFFLKYNQDGWAERAYRDALQVANDIYADKFGATLRDATIQQDGVRLVVRDPFTSAVYDWNKRPVVLGTVPRLSDKSIAVQTFRNAVRYTENLLRTEKQFPAKLRGVEIGPLLSAALNRRFAGYAKTSHPRATIQIDFARAKDLARESEAVRERLLIGIDDAPETLHDAGSSRRSPDEEPRVKQMPSGIPDGLLTDLDAIRSAIESASGSARAILEVLVSVGWEIGIGDAALADAAGGALVAPLITELNHHALLSVGDVLIVQEGEKLVVEEDFRDEVYWVVRGTLDGFLHGSTPPSIEVNPSASKDTKEAENSAATEGFELRDLQSLSTISLGGPDVTNRLSEIAARNAATPLLLIDHINEVGLACSYGDLLVDGTTTPPSIMADAIGYVSDLLRTLGDLSPGFDSTKH
jgi:hypothetical protein